MKNFNILRFIFLLYLATFTINGLQAQLKADTILVIQIRKEIAPRITRLVSNGIEQAKIIGANLIILDMNTYGGLLQDADSIRIAILNCPIPIWTYVNKNAASAGALIAISSDKIFMQAGSSIGAATVVTEDGKAAPDKYQSYMRAIMRSTAEAKGKDSTGLNFLRDPKIAEAMVDDRIFIEGIIETGKTLTFTSSEALKNNYCEGIYASLTELLEKETTGKRTVIEHKETGLDKLIGWLLHPAVRGILIAGILFGLYFEIQTPGLGLPSIAAIAAALLYFAPAYLDGLAENWEMLLFLLGAILVIIELVAIPGFGVLGIGGIVLIFTSLVLAMVRNINLDFSFVSPVSYFQSVATVFIIVVVFVLYVLFFGSDMSKSLLFAKVVHKETFEGTKSNFFVADIEQFIGREALVINECKPEGKVKIDNQIYAAKTLVGSRKRGALVIIVSIENNYLVVK